MFQRTRLHHSLSSLARAEPSSPLGLGAGAGFACRDCSAPWLLAAAQRLPGAVQRLSLAFWTETPQIQK